MFISWLPCNNERSTEFTELLEITELVRNIKVFESYTSSEETGNFKYEKHTANHIITTAVLVLLMFKTSSVTV